MKRLFRSLTLPALILASSTAFADEPCSFTYGKYSAAGAKYLKVAEKQRIVLAINLCKNGYKGQCNWLDKKRARNGFGSSVVHDDAFVTEFTANANKALSQNSDELTDSALPTINCLKDRAINKGQRDIKKAVKNNDKKQ